MVDINELIQELLLTVNRIVEDDWNPKSLDSEKSKIEYSDLIHDLTWSTISFIKTNELENYLLNMENSMSGVIPNKERCELIAKKLKGELNSNLARLYNKGRKERRENMNNALKEFTIPFIRNHAFKGTFPNFTKDDKDEKISLKFQFSQFGSQFIVELKSSSIGKETLRLGSIKNQRSYWYDFEDTNKEINIYKLRAEEIINNWDEAEYWFTL